MPSVWARKPTGSVFMPKRSRTPPRAASAPAKPQGRQPRHGIVHTSVYLPEGIYEAPTGGGVSGEMQNQRTRPGGH
jgi:hypothetical protein